MDFLVQGTIYPDVVESGLGGESAVIKSHHNVGGLPDYVDFKEIIEPLRDLFKDEVRKVGLELGIPEYLVFRQPFPGPGLGIRIIGELDFDIVDITAMLAELKDFDIYQDILAELNKIVDDPDFYLEIPFEINLGADEVDLDAQDSMSEAKINIMTAKTANKKKRKFFTISKAQLLRNKPKNKIKNRENRAKNRAYKRANAAKIKRYQISRQRLIDKGLHHVKLRRKA